MIQTRLNHVCMVSSSKPARPVPTTRERLLEAADRLFSKHGPSHTSVRAITSEAGTNVASVSYHFGSRDGLLREVVSRRLVPITNRSLERLAELEAADGRPRLEDVVAAFAVPMLEELPADPVLSELFGLLFHEPEVARDLRADLVSDLDRRVPVALQRSLPELRPEDIDRRFAFAAGVIVHELLARVRGGLSAPTTQLDDLVAFISAGLRAPVPEPTLPE